MKKVIVINGPGKSGKDTFVCMARLLLRDSGIDVYNFTTIFPIKKKLVDDGIWDGVSEKTEEIRTKMVKLKEFMTDNGDMPNRYVVEKITNLEDDSIIFVHIREAINIQKFLDLAKKELSITPITLHLERHSSSIGKFNSGVDLSEQTREFKDYDYEIDIRKDGFGHLKEVITDFLSKVEKDIQFSEFDFSDVKNKEIHKPFDDQMQAGIT